MNSVVPKPTLQAKVGGSPSALRSLSRIAPLSKRLPSQLNDLQGYR